MSSVHLAALMVLVLGTACTNGRNFIPTDGGAIGGLGGSVDAHPTGTGGTAGHIGAAGGSAAQTGGSGGAAASGSGGQTGGAGGRGTSGSGGAAGSTSNGGSTGSGGTTGPGGTTGSGGTTPNCSSTQHLCNTGCADNASPATCGTQCNSACPSPAGGTATCDGTNCGFTCGGSTPKQCAAAGICIASAGCCTNSDCPVNAGGQTGTCDTATHTCDYSCAGSTHSCTSGGTAVCLTTAQCCTNSDCPGNCMACNTSTHTCAAVKSMDDPNGRCTGTCDPSGACKSKQGQTCSAGSQCITTFCADGVCCNSGCTGSCEYCNGSTPGTCGFASGAPKTGHPACAGSGACAGSCNATKATCNMPAAETSCRSMSCSGSTQTNAAACDGAGNCPTVSTKACAPYVCNGNTSCNTTCTSASQCASGLVCQGGACKSCTSGQTACGTNCCSGATPVCANGTTCVECAANADCTSKGYFACSNNACICRPQDSRNLVHNGGLDTGTTFWTPDGSPGFVSNQDADGCPRSGAYGLLSFADNVSQCVLNITGGTAYTVGFKFKSAAATTEGFCQIYYYTDASCADSSDILGTDAAAVNLDGVWNAASNAVTTPAGTQSVSLVCKGVYGPGYYDQIFFSSGGAAF